MRFSLRYRVALAFLMLGWLISMAMGGTLYWLTISLEKELIEEIISTELEDYISSYTLDSPLPPPSNTHFQGYVITTKSQTTLPNELQHLPSGLNHIKHIKMNGVGYYVKSRVHNTTRFFMLYADEMIRQRENEYLGFLAIGIGLMTLLSGTLGFWLADQVITPASLAQQVSTMNPHYSPSPLPINAIHPLDEVGKLTQTIDSYHQRLADFNERERAFTSNVSHELRTPLAVIKGAAEVMLAQKNHSLGDQRRIERIARAAAQMARLITALLTLAREESDNEQKHQYPVKKILRQVVNEHQYLLNHKSVVVKLHTHHDLLITSDPTLLYVVLANIIRNAYSYTSQGTVHIRLEGKRVVIEDTGVGMKKDQLLRMFDRYYSDHHANGGHGIGLSLVRRICERYSWRISVHSREGQGTSVELRL